MVNIQAARLPLLITKALLTKQAKKKGNAAFTDSPGDPAGHYFPFGSGMAEILTGRALRD
jgi:hypothetical protein